MHLEHLLDQAREPMPVDDGFTLRVMDQIRSAPDRRPTLRVVAPVQTGRWRSRLTRPMLLAAAAVIIAGGALAAGGLTDFDPIPTVAPSTEPSTAPAAEEPAPLVSAPRARATSAPAKAASARKAGATSGYLTAHTAFVVGNGLRLETETFDATAVAGATKRVQLTVENTTDRAIAMTARESCLLEVVATSGQTTTTTCAASPIGTVLRPHERRVVTANVPLARGTWTLTGVCNCFEAGGEPIPADPGAPPTTGLGRVAATAPILPTARVAGPTNGGGTLVTPPITVVAR